MRFRHAIPLVVVMSVVLAGCPGEEEEDGGGGSPATEATAAPTPAPTTAPDAAEITVLLDALQAPTQGTPTATLLAARLKDINDSWAVRPGELDEVAKKTCYEPDALGEYVRYKLPGVDFRAWTTLHGLVDLVTVTCRQLPADVVQQLRDDVIGVALRGSLTRQELPVQETNTVVAGTCDLLQRFEDQVTDVVEELIQLGSRHRLQPGDMYKVVAAITIHYCRQVADTARELLEALRSP